MKKFNLYKTLLLSMLLLIIASITANASSHREAPLIANDPLADNVDLYAFRSPDNPNTVTIIATYIPMQLPFGGPNYYNFGENIRYEIHVDNDASVPGDEVTYRFTFNIENEDPTTFFNIRLGAQNQKATYTLERSVDGGRSFQTIVRNGVVPPNNIGPRSIESGVGLGTTYEALYQGAITTASTGETVFAGPTDDPFFVDLAGIFDLGDAPRQNGKPIDNLACLNVSAIAIQIPISTLLKAGAPAQPTSILDSDYVIGVWASASRPAVTTLSATGAPTTSGDWIQVSRLGMPLTNEAVIAIKDKDYWNAISPYEEITETTLDEYFYNPELALYMDDDLFGGAVPALAPLRIQTNSLGSFDFSNGADGLYGLKGNPALAGTALDDAVFGTLLLPAPGKPRSVDLWPAFHTGVPNVIPYQLATGKGGNPLAAGKPFVNNFLPNGGDMLRLNMAVPPTPRDDANFSSLGLVQAAAIGLTVPPFNTTADLEFIPNMDGFPNGRRLEDDVTRIELQAVGGVVLAAVGLWYDDFDPATSASPVTQDLLDVLTYTTGVEENDVPFRSSFPYLALPASGTGKCSGKIIDDMPDENNDGMEGMAAQFFVSSNTQQAIGVGNIQADGSVMLNTFRNVAGDADGIHYDEAADVLYQLNRMNGSVNAYSNVNASLMNGMTPPLTASSSADSKNGREIAVSGGRLVVAQDANDANGMRNRFYVYNASPTSIRLDKTYDVDFNLWGIHAAGETLFAIEDNSDRLAIFNNFFAPASGVVTPNQVVRIENMVRTHGLTYVADRDMMILTDVGAASSPTDGAIVIVRGFMAASADGFISADEQTRIAGAASLLGNPVDVAFDKGNNMIYVAERANGGGRVLGFMNTMTSGDTAPAYDELFAGASAIHLPGEDTAAGPMLSTSAQLFASSNNQQMIGVYNILEDRSVAAMGFSNVSPNADGIYYDEGADILYQVNRTNGSVNSYGSVNANLSAGMRPQYLMSSSANFSNGRELAWSNGRLVVAQDANDGNGNTNKLVVYSANNGAITFQQSYNVDINLWGIHAEGETLYAVVDNSNRLAVYDNFFSNTGTSISASRTIAIDNLVRTHGITYIADRDMMLLTDVGAASSPTDGAYIVIRNFMAASSDGVISSNEQIRIAGDATWLGNPVDIAYDAGTDMVFIAERANGGGRILGYTLPSASGNTAPIYNNLFAGASAVYLSGTNGGMSAFAEMTTFKMRTGSIDETRITPIQPDLDKAILEKVKVYPNPAIDYINLELPIIDQQEQLQVSIFDGFGRQLQVINTDSELQQIDVSHYTSGMYYILVNTPYQKRTVKFLKQARK